MNGRSISYKNRAMHVSAFQTAIESARSMTELIKTVKQAQPLVAFLKQWQLFIYFITTAIVLLIIATAIYNYHLFNHFTAAIFAIIMIAITILLIRLLPELLKKHSITYLSDLIYNKSVLLNNQLEKVSFDKKQQVEILSNVFHEFKRGNDLKEIIQLHKGYYQGKTYCFKYYFYSFHYTVRPKQTRVNRKKARRKSVIQPYYRYGIYLPFHFAKNILILNDPPDLYDTKPIITLPQFDIELDQLTSTKDIFFFAQDEPTLSRFLTTEVTTELGVIMQKFNQVNLEFSAQSELCLSFSNEQLIHFKRQHSLNEPDHFLSELTENKKSLKLEQVLTHIHALMESTKIHCSDGLDDEG